MTPRTLLDLGRVSNLPTVWTNVLAGAVLSHGSFHAATVAVLCAAASLLYVGGMFLNDAFDRDFDRRFRPERPIPSGRAAAGPVFGIGFALLASAVVLVGLASWLSGPTAGSGRLRLAPLTAALALSALVVVYDAFHKRSPWSVVIMGLCRAGLYLMAALTVGSLTTAAGVGALLLLLYVVTLSLLARKEATIPRLRGQVGRLIAGICLLDAALIALTGPLTLAGAAVLGFPLTLAAQRYVQGT